MATQTLCDECERPIPKGENGAKGLSLDTNYGKVLVRLESEPGTAHPDLCRPCVCRMVQERSDEGQQAKVDVVDLNTHRARR